MGLSALEMPIDRLLILSHTSFKVRYSTTERELPLLENWENIYTAALRAKQNACCTAVYVLAAHAGRGDPGWGAADTQQVHAPHFLLTTHILCK